MRASPRPGVAGYLDTLGGDRGAHDAFSLRANADIAAQHASRRSNVVLLKWPARCSRYCLTQCLSSRPAEGSVLSCATVLVEELATQLKMSGASRETS